MIGGADRASAHLAVTRAGWHRVAEHILPPPSTGRPARSAWFGPRAVSGPRPSGRTAGSSPWTATELVVSDARGTKRTPLTTIRAAAEFAGVTPGAPAGVYEPATPLDLDEPLMIDPDAARLLAEWYGLGAQALSRFAAEIPGDKPAGPCCGLSTSMSA